ncbi:MAG: TSUP family transporter [Pseudomonadota bacterium]
MNLYHEFLTNIHFLSHNYFILFSYLIFMGFLSGFIDAIAGGGGLISLPALILTGMPISEALGSSKLQGSVGTGVAVYKYYREGLIQFSTVCRGLIMGLIGAVCGACLVNYVSNQFMQFIVPFLLLGVFVFNFFQKSLGVHPGVKRLPEHIFFPVFGFILGFYDAFFGPGTGNFWIISIVFFLGYTFLEASGYAKILNLKSNLFSLIIFIFYGKVNFLLGIVMAIGQMLGGYLGAHAVILKGSKLVRPFFLSVVFINMMVTFYTLMPNFMDIIGKFSII